MSNPKKIVLAIDSFKGTLTAKQCRTILAQAILKRYPDCQIEQVPISDGGEGSLTAILDCVAGKKYSARVSNPVFDKIDADYAILYDNTAVIEMATCSGLTLVSPLQPMRATTFGVGELIQTCLDKGCRKFLLCLGGSATSDGGCGMACALGVKFFDKSGNSFVPTGGTLSDITRIDCSGFDARVKESAFTVMSDVTNPLYGKLGAAYVYSAQKGATPSEIEQIDRGLVNLAQVFGTDKGLHNQPGAGSAGGLGYGCLAFLNATIVKGIQCMLDLAHYDDLVKDADLVITGEGRIDEQSFMGKVVDGILARSMNKRVVAVCGVCKLDAEFLDKKGLEVFAMDIAPNTPWEQIVADSKRNLCKCAETLLDKVNF